MGPSVEQDITLLEQLGHTRNEALDLVIERALTQERDVADDLTGSVDARRRAYLDELRGMCLPKAS